MRIVRAKKGYKHQKGLYSTGRWLKRYFTKRTCRHKSPLVLKEQTMLDFNDYQKQAWSTAIYPNKGTNLYYPTLGLAGEAGEVAEKVKKIMRDDNGEVTPEKKEELRKEIGDVLWYVAAICSTLDISMEEVAQLNIDKLLSRKERGKLQGDGDNR